MVDSPEHLFEDFVKAGSDIITIHCEAMKNVSEALGKIKHLGVKSGISLKPATSEEEIFSFLDEVDLVLVMTVDPGFGGQAFMDNQLKKISNIREKLSSIGRKDVIISVDGGINQNTAPKAIAAGANMLVSGSYIFKSGNYKSAIDNLRV
jgi:ribulose-phosphate 3-epimerase